MNDTGKKSFFLVIFALLMAVSLIGAAGFYACEHKIQPGITVWDSFWWSMVTITTIGYGDIFPKTIGGRLIALVLMFSGIGTLGIFTAAIAAFFIRGDGFQLLRLRRFHDHVIVCGLGQKGMLLVRALREKNWPVVVIQVSEANEYLETARDSGAVVLIGDAREAGLLKRAHIDTARHLVALCGDDGINAEIAAHARDLSQDRTYGVLVCSAQIVDPELWFLLREWEISQSGPFHLQFFNLVDSAARSLLDEFPPFEEMNLRSPHIVIVGKGRIGQSLLVHMARAWRDIAEEAANGKEPEKLRVTLIDQDIETAIEALHLRHPELVRVCNITSLSIDINSPEFHRGEFLFDAKGHCEVTYIYVCMPNDAKALSAALSLHGRTRYYDVPIVVTMTRDSGLASLLHGGNGSVKRFKSVHAVGLLERACQPDLVLGGIHEVLAMALHDKYVEDQEAKGETREKNSSLVSWTEVSEETRESNRAQARDISEKLRAIGCDIVPLTDWDAGKWVFDDDEVELMAAMEHGRWLKERADQGWTLGPRDVEKKTNPNMIPWEQVPEDGRNYNRDLVREIPNSLLRAGFQVYRAK